MTGISHSPQLIAPTLGDALSVQFTLVTPADVTMRIYEEDVPATVLRTISLPGLGAVPHTVPWDGKDDAGNFVPDEGYVYVLTTDVAGFSDVFNPAAAPGQTTAVAKAGQPAAPIPTTYNVHRNQPLKILFDMNSNRSRVRVNRTLTGVPPVTLVNTAPFPHLFNQLFVYDGFDPSGNFLEAGSPTPTFHFGHPVPMKRNAVIVERTTPLIAGPTYVSARKNPVSPKTPPPAQMPAIEVKGEPYLIRLSYDQVSRIAFCIDQAAYLTVKILKPGRGDPGVPADVVATLVQDVPGTMPPHAARDCTPAGGAAPYVVEWDGTEASAADPFVMRSVADGSYTFTIEARNALQTNLRSLYRGIVQTRQ
jgi:hypothetical protein